MDTGSSGGGYGYGGGGYYYGGGYGYGYGGGGDQQGGANKTTRTLRDYISMLRERLWLCILIFLLIFGGSVLYCFHATRIYAAATKVQVLRNNPKAMETRIEDLDQSDVRNSADLRTQIDILASNKIIQDVAQSLQGQDLLKQFMAPYEDIITLKGRPPTPTEVLATNRTIIPNAQSLTVSVIYEHPDPVIAAEIANRFAKAFVEHNTGRSMDMSLRAVEDLKERVDKQRVVVEELEKQLADYRERYGAVSLEQRSDTLRRDLNHIKDIQTAASTDLDAAQARLELVNQYREEGRDLWDLAFIGDQRQVANLLAGLSDKKVNLAALEKRYLEKHPRMIEARRAVQQSEMELEKVVNSAAEKIKSDYLAAKEAVAQATERLKQQEQQIFELARIAPEYTAMERQVEVAQEFFQGLLMRLETETAQTNMIYANVEIIDKAYPPLDPSWPRIPMILFLGLVFGSSSGIGVVLLLGLLDDRVKSSFDVESSLGVQLVGVIPKVSRLDSFEKASIVANGLDRRVTEAFRSLYSSLKIGESSKDARVVLFTSTLPSEGKSFVCTNLALTYANHGEKVLVIDCDLRMPAIAHSMGLHQMQGAHRGGLVEYFEGDVGWDEMILSNVFPNLDILPSSRRAKKPTQILESGHFEEMLEIFRSHYDRIFIDTPPMGVVSDALNIMPKVDGSIYVVKYNGVKLRMAKGAVRRVLDSNVPLLGIVMNQIKLRTATYYHNYTPREYEHYYNDDVEDHSPLPENTKDTTSRV